MIDSEAKRVWLDDYRSRSARLVEREYCDHLHWLELLYRCWSVSDERYFSGGLGPTWIGILDLRRRASYDAFGEYVPPREVIDFVNWVPKTSTSSRPTGSKILIDTRMLRAISKCAKLEQERFVFDILLHEMVHQALFEREQLDGEPGYPHDHGPRFAAECDRAGRLVGLPETTVEIAYRWPRHVRPESYYPEVMRMLWPNGDQRA